MTKYYVTNSNSDWWTMDTDSEIYVISESDLKAKLIEDGEHPEIVENLEWQIDLEGVIPALGKAIQPMKLIEGN